MRRCNTTQMAARVENYRVACFFVCARTCMHACRHALRSVALCQIRCDGYIRNVTDGRVHAIYCEKSRKMVQWGIMRCKTMRRCSTTQMAARVKNYRVACFFCRRAYMHACMQACMHACTTLRCIMSNQMRRIQKKCHRRAHTCNKLRKKSEKGA